MQEIAALRVAIKRNSQKYLEDWILKWESKNREYLLEQFNKGISEEIHVQIYYHEDDNYNELWKVVGTPKGVAGKYYVRATESGGYWYTVCDPLGYCERNYSVKDDVLFIICNPDGNPIGASSNINSQFPTLKQTAKAEWNRIKNDISHFEEDKTKNFWSLCWDGTSTLSINQWLETFMDTDLYADEIKEMHGYPENWVMRCKECSKEAVSTFNYLGVGYAIYKVKYKHEICGVEYYEFFSGRYPFMKEHENYIDFYASWFDAKNVGTMYSRKTAINKVKEELKKIYGNSYVCEYKERYGGKLIYPLTMEDITTRLIGNDLHRAKVDSIADNERINPTYELITPELFTKYGDDLEIVSHALGCTVALKFNDAGKLISYI